MDWGNYSEKNCSSVQVQMGNCFFFFLSFSASIVDATFFSGPFLRNMILLTFFINFSHILVWKRTRHCESLNNFSWLNKQNQKLSFAQFKFQNFTKLGFFLISLTSFNPYLLLRYLTASFNSWAIKKEIRSCQRHNGPMGWVLLPN